MCSKRSVEVAEQRACTAERRESDAARGGAERAAALAAELAASESTARAPDPRLRELSLEVTTALRRRCLDHRISVL